MDQGTTETSNTPTVSYGAEPGLRFASLLDGHGGCKQLCMDEVCAWKPGEGVTWLHLERDHPATADWVTHKSGSDPFVIEALLEEDLRPRVEPVGDGLLIILRGVCATSPDGVTQKPADIDLVPCISGSMATVSSRSATAATTSRRCAISACRWRRKRAAAHR